MSYNADGGSSMDNSETDDKIFWRGCMADIISDMYRDEADKLREDIGKCRSHQRSWREGVEINLSDEDRKQVLDAILHRYGTLTSPEDTKRLIDSAIFRTEYGDISAYEPPAKWGDFYPNLCKDMEPYDEPVY